MKKVVINYAQQYSIHVNYCEYFTYFNENNNYVDMYKHPAIYSEISTHLHIYIHCLCMTINKQYDFLRIVHKTFIRVY